MSIARWLVLCGLAAGLLGCVQPRRQPPAPGLKVVTSFVPITLFTKAVAGDCAEVKGLIPAPISPHDFQARPADLLALQQAQVLVINGLGLESPLGKLIAAAANPRLRVIDSSKGIPSLSESKAQAGHGHDHDHGDGDGHGAGAGHHRGTPNPHVWLDPQRAMQQVRRIRDGLIAADPACREGYTHRAEQFLSALQGLDRRLAQQLRPFRDQTFVAFHDVAPYFAQRYGLKVVTLVGDPEHHPSPQDMRRVIEAVQATRIKTLMVEPQQNMRSFEALAGDYGLNLSVFDPLETATTAQSMRPNTYITVMQQNGDRLAAAFQR